MLQTEHLDTVKFLAGESVFKEGDLGNTMFLVRTGRIAIYKSHQGQEIQIAVLEQGDFFGEMAILESLPRFASAQAMTDCTLARVDSAGLEGILGTNMELAVRMLRKLSWRIRSVEDRYDRLLQQFPAEVQNQVLDLLDGDTLPGRSLDGTVYADLESHVVRARSHNTPKLEHVESAKIFSIPPGDECTIGRGDSATGIHPDINLAEIDQNYSLSRRHAKIFLRDGTWYLLEELGVLNGTFINGRKLNPGVPAQIGFGDELALGLIRMVFRA